MSTATSDGVATGAPAARAPRRGPVTPPPSGPRGRLAAVLAVLALATAVMVIATRLSAPPPAPEAAGALPADADPPAPPTPSRGRTPVHPDERIAALEARLAADPDDAGAWRDLGLAHHARSLRAADPTAAVRAAEALERADALAPGDFRTTTARAVVAATRHDFAGAARLAEPVVAANPDAADARAVLVDAYIELGRYDAAAAQLDELGARRPGLATLARISYLRELRGDLPGAIDAMRRAVAAGSRDPYEQARIQSLAGDLLLLADRVDEADTAYARAESLVPELDTSIAGYAKVRLARGDVPGAESVLADHFARSPSVAVAGLLGEIRGRRGAGPEEVDPLSAFAEGKLAEEAAAGYDVALEAAEAALGRGESEAALRAAEDGYARRPDNVIAGEVLAWVRFQTGDVAGTAALVPAFTRLDSADLHQHLRAAEILEAAGELDGARARLRRLAHFAPWDSPAVIHPAREIAARLGVELSPAWQRAGT